MRDSVKHVTKQSFDAYDTTDRNKWVIEWPGQVVICVDSSQCLQRRKLTIMTSWCSR